MYVAGWNMPGYLPEVTEEFNSFADAKVYINSEIYNVMDQDELPRKDMTKYRNIMDEICNWQTKEGIAGFEEEFSTFVMPNGYVYFIQGVI